MLMGYIFLFRGSFKCRVELDYSMPLNFGKIPLLSVLKVPWVAFRGVPC